MHPSSIWPIRVAPAIRLLGPASSSKATVRSSLLFIVASQIALVCTVAQPPLSVINVNAINALAGFDIFIEFPFLLSLGLIAPAAQIDAQKRSDKGRYASGV